MNAWVYIKASEKINLGCCFRYMNEKKESKLTHYWTIFLHPLVKRERKLSFHYQKGKKEKKNEKKTLTFLNVNTTMIDIIF